jgi:hypothetical protein
MYYMESDKSDTNTELHLDWYPKCEEEMMLLPLIDLHITIIPCSNYFKYFAT